jgi:hypothetical protein
MMLPLFYLLAITIAEMVTILNSPLYGVILHGFLVVGLLAHASFNTKPINQKLYLALVLVPFIRILSLSMPLGAIPIVYWYAIIAVPLLTATFISMRLLGYSRWDVGLTAKRIPIQVLIGLIGLPLGILEYIVLKPEPLTESFSAETIVLPAVILIIGTGFTEEFIFRGVLQKAASDKMRGWGLLYVSVLFSLLHVGYYSLLEIVFVFSVGLFFAWLVAKTGSIMGTSLAHGLLNVCLFIIMPFFGTIILPSEGITIPDFTFFPSNLSYAASVVPTPSAQAHEKPGNTPAPSPQPQATQTNRRSEGSPSQTATPKPYIRGEDELTSRGESKQTTAAKDLLISQRRAIFKAQETNDVKAGIRVFWPFKWHVSSISINASKSMMTDATKATGTPRTPTPTPTQELNQNAVPSDDMTVYTVGSGDTLFSLAIKFGVSLNELKALNDIDDADNIFAGQLLIIPQSANYPP